MRLSNEWFTALSENESGQLVTVSGRDELTEFIQSGKFKERVEITWKYEGDDKGMPSEALAEKMEEVQEVLRKAMEKDKLSILTGVYTGGGERIWVYYTRTVRVFGERLMKPWRRLKCCRSLSIRRWTPNGRNTWICMR